MRWWPVRCSRAGSLEITPGSNHAVQSVESARKCLLMEPAPTGCGRTASSGATLPEDAVFEQSLERGKGVRLRDYLPLEEDVASLDLGVH